MTRKDTVIAKSVTGVRPLEEGETPESPADPLHRTYDDPFDVPPGLTPACHRGILTVR
jgi:hypothetical protein